MTLAPDPAAPSAVQHPLDELRFDNRYTRSLPADPLPPEHVPLRRQVTGAAFSRVRPTPVRSPRTLAWSEEVAELLGIDPAVCASQDFAEVFSGNRLPSGADPFSMVYGGHQFGSWAGQLGDGRAIALGEVRDEHGGHQTLQLKGAGPTPYSRTADGRAVLRSSIREFLCSEAMHHLGIPTTRALSLVATGEPVVRDMLYDGNPEPEPGAVVCRVAPSFTRFGNFQLPASRQDDELLRRLVEHTIRNDFPGIAADAPFQTQVVEWYREVCVRTAELVAGWMRVGFVHGVLNTDNMSILGLTIDYGPYGWLEGFDPMWTPNTTDAGMLRYKFGTQPDVAQWNLLQLARALLPLAPDAALLQEAFDAYRTTYDRSFASMMAARLGFGAFRESDGELFESLFALLGQTETDYVLFFRNLAAVPVSSSAADDDLLAPLRDAYYAPDDIFADPDSEVRAATVRWLRRWAERAVEGGLSDAERVSAMNALNPRFVLRNWLAQEAIDLATDGDTSRIWELLDVLRRPYDEQPAHSRFAERRPDWARTKVGCSMLSCSS